MKKKEVILESAIKLFSENGYDGTSVRDIASAAGVNVAMISYYFGSKEKLFESMVEYRASFLKTIFSKLVSNMELSSIEKIDIVIDQTIERKFSNSQFHHLLHRELSMEARPQCKEVISDILLKNLSHVKSIIKKGIANGEFNPVDVELTITTLIGTIHYLLTSDTMCRKILGKKEGFNPFQNAQLKKRLSEHTKKLARSFLLKK